MLRRAQGRTSRPAGSQNGHLKYVDASEGPIRNLRLKRTHAGSTIPIVKTAESKTQRWNMRVAEDVDAIVRLAAEQTNQPLTDFVVQAARVVAEDTLADRRVFRLDEAAWDEFVEILDRPARPVPELSRLLSSSSVFDD
jgi:uncharacterized protein (DUF1778 family)